MRPRHDYEQAIYLAYGVTTTLDISMCSQNMFPTAELIEAGEMIGPRGFSTGDNITAGDAARANEINNPADALAMVRKMADWGAVSIKQYAQPRRDQRQWMAEAARTVGINVTSEGGHFMENLGFIMDGQTGWEHAFSEVPMYSDGAKFFGKAGATYSPTLVVAGPSAWNIEYWFQESDVWKDREAAALVPVAHARAADARALAAPGDRLQLPARRAGDGRHHRRGRLRRDRLTRRAPRPRAALGGVDGRVARSATTARSRWRACTARASSAPTRTSARSRSGSWPT